MRAFINCKYTKQQALAIAQSHYDQDQFLKGAYGDAEDYGTTEFKGCSVGCMANGLHGNYPELFGIIPQIAYLSDSIFEGLNVAESKEWTLQLFNAIREGSDTKAVFHKFMYWLLVDKEHGVIRFGDSKIIHDVADLHLRSLTETIRQEEWNAARADAWDAWNTAADADTWAAATRVAAAAAREAALAAAWEARDAVAIAAVAATRATWDATREKHYQIMRDKLLDLFESEVIA